MNLRLVGFYQFAMSKLQNLSVFLTDRLTLAAQEIFKAVEDVFLEYNDEICRSKVEIELLKKRLLQAGIEIEPQAGSSENPDQNYTQMLSGEWTSEPSENETEIHTKIEVYTHDGNVQMPGCEDLASSHASRDDICTQGYKNLESLTPENSWNSSFINHNVHIKNEPESDIETSTTCQMQLFTSHDSRSREQFGDINEIKINHTGFTRLPFMNEELLMQQAAHLAPISESSSNIEPKKSSARARSQKHRLKVSRNPELLEMYRRRERESKLQSVRERMRKRKGQNEEMLREKKTRQTEAFQQTNQADGTEGFPCVVCHRKFNTPALRKVHLRVHSGEKPYHCRFCGKNFRQSSHLKTHVRIHTGERPHTCKTCGKTFVDSSGRNRHVRKCSLQRT